MEKLKLVLVDDEAIILKGLAETYDWGNMGFQVVGAARDGEEALKMILEKNPELVLTDVRMKKMSGLTLMEKANEQNLNTDFVVVSAYKDFEYAKKACENGALSYLVKPIDDLELENTMHQVYETCMKKKCKDRNYEMWEKMLIEDRENFLNQLIGKYLTGGVAKEEITDFFNSLNRKKDLEDNYIAIIVGIDVTKRVLNQKEFDLKQYVLDSTIYQKLSEHYLVWTMKSDGSTCYLVNIGEKNNREPFNQLLTTVKKNTDSNLISAISKVDKGIKGMKKIYQEAVQLFEIAGETDAGILEVNNNAAIKVKPQYSLELESQMVVAILKNNERQLKETYKKFIYLLPTDDRSIKIYLQRLSVRIEFTLDKNDGLTKEMAQEFQNFHKAVETVIVVKLINVLYQLLLSVIEQRKKMGGIFQKEYFRDYMKYAMEYIQEHLQEESLSITQVSESVYLNPVYFGRLFKNMTNVSFKKYVQNLRIQKAKELLLEDEDSIANISRKVGIPNASYFAQLFKRYTGVLPSEYIRSLSGDE